MPVHRLDEAPTEQAILADITCDSDGKLDTFIDIHGVKRVLELHEVRPCEPYYLGAFLVGAYQETLTKADKEESDLFLAQGGICVLKDEKDYEAYFEDTMRAGHYENNRESVDIMISSSRDVIRDLLTYGVDFQRDGYGNLCFYERRCTFFTADIVS